MPTLVLDPELALALFVAPVLLDAARRQRLVSLRQEGTIGDDAFQRVEQELDWEELSQEELLRTEKTAG